nr:immunoglobulin heavy chain junction region [Macaca mulatta]MOX41011.1 immunoglobulin heavy chain junction region [Macaca mulatta]
CAKDAYGFFVSW